MATGRMTLWRLIVLNWPRIVAAGGTAERFVREHPETEAWLRQQVQDLRGQVVATQRRRGESAPILGTLDVVRRLIGEIEARRGGAPNSRTSSWGSRADHIDRTLQIAEAAAPADRSRECARLLGETDALLSEVVAEITLIRSLPRGRLGDTTPPGFG
jgi:hypothetical protein